MHSNALCTTVIVVGALSFSLAAAKQPGHTTTTQAPPPVAKSVTTPLVLDGKPFPRVTRYMPPPSKGARKFYVAPVKVNGDGGEKTPWNDLQAALAAVSPGDELHVKRGAYKKNYSIDATCKEGVPGSPISLVFEENSALMSPAAAPALTIGRAGWMIYSPNIKLGAKGGAGIVIATNDVWLDGARITGGTETGIAIASGVRHVTVSNCMIAKGRQGADSAGIDVARGTSQIIIGNNHVYQAAAGGIRVGTSGTGQSPSEVTVNGNTVRECSPAILIEHGNGTSIAENTLTATVGATERGIVLLDAYHATVRSNALADFDVAISVGQLDPQATAVRFANEAVIEHNHISTTADDGAALDLEAGTRLRFTNNLIEGYRNALLLLGTPPLTRDVTIANNVILGVSGVAFSIASVKTASLFDFNAFSPSNAKVQVEVEGKTMPLDLYLKGGLMPNTSSIRGAKVVGRDIARIAGLTTVDKGKPIAGIRFSGKAPDLGVAEK
jgi:hypothetical protein